MKCDLLYELQMPKPHDADTEWRCYHQALEQIDLADRLGYGTVWAVRKKYNFTMALFDDSKDQDSYDSEVLTMVIQKVAGNDRDAFTG